MKSASKLACTAFGLAPLGAEARIPTRCALCGDAIAIGESVERWKPGQNFLDHPATAAERTLETFEGRDACGACAHMMTKPLMHALGYAVITADAVYPLADDKQRAWLLTDPPEPPFAVVIKTAKLQHLVWRAPVTLSRELLRVQIGTRTLPIRRPLVREAIERIDRDLDGRHPFAKLDRNGDDMAHGQIRPGLDPDTTRWFARLGPGELWALAVLAKRNRPAPERGDPIQLKGSKQ